MATAAQELAALLAAQDSTPIELGGATALFEAISGGKVTAEVRGGGRRQLTDDERRRLRPGSSDTACSRHGVLRTAGGVPVAEITAVILPRRVPGPARPDLGITASGTPLEGARSIPLGRALRGRGVTREQIEARLTPGAQDASGARLALYSAALLRIAVPLALVTERVYEEFLEAFPPPWPVPAEMLRPALVTARR
jgi:hypothetical protein